MADSTYRLGGLREQFEMPNGKTIKDLAPSQAFDADGKAIVNVDGLTCFVFSLEESEGTLGTFLGNIVGGHEADTIRDRVTQNGLAAMLFNNEECFLTQGDVDLIEKACTAALKRTNKDGERMMNGMALGAAWLLVASAPEFDVREEARKAAEAQSTDE